jgi:four helix bundle protein
MSTFSFENLIGWQKGVVFVNDLFEIGDALPQKYQFSLGEQLRRAALSITNNIAEGSGRSTPKTQRYFYDIAKGSIFEVVIFLVIIKKRGLINDGKYKNLRKQAFEITSILFGLIKAINRISKEVPTYDI